MTAVRTALLRQMTQGPAGVCRPDPLGSRLLLPYTPHLCQFHPQALPRPLRPVDCAQSQELLLQLLETGMGAGVGCPLQCRRGHLGHRQGKWVLSPQGLPATCPRRQPRVRGVQSDLSMGRFPWRSHPAPRRGPAADPRRGCKVTFPHILLQQMASMCGLQACSACYACIAIGTWQFLSGPTWAPITAAICIWALACRWKLLTTCHPWSPLSNRLPVAAWSPRNMHSGGQTDQHRLPRKTSSRQVLIQLPIVHVS